MLEQSRLDHIQAMEAILRQGTALMKEIESLQQQWQQFHPKLQKLKAYYGSEQWFADNQAYDNGEIPAGFPCGVLGEDEVYNLIQEQREYALALIKQAVEALA